MMLRKTLDGDLEDDILNTFRLFDDGEIETSFEDLERVAGEIGEHMRDEELQVMTSAEADRDVDR